MVSCKIDKGWEDAIPKVRSRMTYSRELGIPLASRYDYKSKSRETHLRTKARWLGDKIKAGAEATTGKK